MVLAQLTISLREGFEAALIASIIFAYLHRTNRIVYIKYAWYGILTATASGLFLGYFIFAIYGILPSTVKALFEGVAAFIAVIVLTSIIIWMAKAGKRLKQEIEERIERAITTGAKIGIIAVAFVIVFREALETVLFLIPFVISVPSQTIAGASIGIFIALLLGYAVFKLGMKMKIGNFFYYTSILIVLIAGGLIGYGTHELIEYLEDSNVDLGWFGDKAYVLPITKDNPLHDKHIIGSILAVMVGYTTSAEWGRIIVQLAYLLIVLPLVVNAYRMK